jgi:hypothetical protein
MLVNVLGVVQLLVMYAGLLLLGQGLVYLLSFGRHEDNAVYRFFRFLTSPVTRAIRRVTPEKVADRHVPVVAFFLLFWIYFALAVTIPWVAGAR